MAKLEKLTESEIENVVEVLPKFLAASTKVANKMREEVQKKLRLQLKDISIVKTTETLEKLKRLIIQQHYNSVVAPGEPVGIRAAEAMSQPTTQTALNAFHSAGSASSATVASGIDAIRELYDVKKTRNVENCKIHFKNKDLTFEDIIDLRRKFVGITVSSLIPKREDKVYDPENEPWWYNLYFDLNSNAKDKRLPFDRSVDKGEAYLRLTFKPSKLFEYNLTLTDICEYMKRLGIICIPSPSRYGIIDVFVDTVIITPELNKKIEKNEKSGQKKAEKNRGFTIKLDVNNVSRLFLQLILEPSLSDMFISGVPGITQIFPSEPANIVSIITKEEMVSKNVYRIYIDTIKITLEGIPIEKLLNTFTMCNFDVLEYNDEYIEVQTNDSENRSPKKIINERLQTEESIAEKDYEERKQTEKYPRRNPTPFMRTATYIYARSNGTNLARLLAHPDVDSTTTISTNPHEVNKTLGIEAARNFLIKSYIEIVEANSEYVNPRHVMLLADYQTFKGSLLPVTSKGAAQLNTGTLAKASFEEPMPAFIDAAAFGKTEEIKSTSTSIFVGKRMILGTGSFKARIDRAALEEADRIRGEYRKNSNFCTNISEDAQKAFASNMMSDDDMLAFSSEALGTETNIKVQDLDVSLSTKTISGPELKFATPVPKVIVTKLRLPNYISNILKSGALDNLETVALSTSTRKATAKIQPNGPSIANSLSKKGLPALPRLSAVQISSVSKIKKVEDIDLDNLENLDF
jgi:hypothetical protein